jgi:zinc transport system substrate-binding protein
MTLSTIRCSVTTALLCCCLALAGLPTRVLAGPLVIAAGTTLVSDIVNDLGRDHMIARPLMPAAACPGHTDLRASDLALLHEAKSIVLHDWQARMDAVMGPIRNEPALVGKVRIVDAPGNWMVPERQQAATQALAEVMAELDPEHSTLYRDRARERATVVSEVASELTSRAAPGKGVPVMADVQQKQLLTWFGFNVAAEYGRFEESGPERLAQALQTARQANVRIVADNLQSAGGSGQTLAEDLGANIVVLSNFPAAFPDAPTWAATITENLDRCLAALKRHGK